MYSLFTFTLYYGPFRLLNFHLTDKLQDNAMELLTTLNKLKPTASKGVYMKSIFMSSTMSPSIAVDPKIS